MTPMNAVTHPDPYAYYARLVAERPIYYDNDLNMWIASSAEAVSAVLQNAFCLVRPIAEPIPAHVLNSSLSQIFCRLVRMQDGVVHNRFKSVITTTFESFDSDHIVKQSNRWASFLISQVNPLVLPDSVSDLAFQLPLYVVGSLLGVPADLLPQTTIWIRDLVNALKPTSHIQQIEQGKIAANNLLQMIKTLLAIKVQDESLNLLQHLSYTAKCAGQKDETIIIANAIGFLSQAYEATAGLINNTLAVLATNPAIQKSVLLDISLLSDVIDEVLRHDPPIQNTRRFLGQDSVIMGQAMKKADTILVMLAAANRDPLLNSNPTQFDICRQRRTSFSFGLGLHTCPGQKLAAIIARVGLEQLIAAEIDFKQLGILPKTFFPSSNVRIHIFASK